MGDDDIVVETLSEVPVERPLNLRDKSGATVRYTIREMSPDDFASWLEIAGASTNGKPKKKTIDKEQVVKSQEEKVELISWCLYDDTFHRVEKDRIRSWGVGTLNRVAEICVEVNRLGGGKV